MLVSSRSQHFTCSSCASAIAPNDPRVRCLVCTDACDMCAACVLGERFKAPHLGTHAVQVLKQSGCVAAAASGSSESESDPGVDVDGNGNGIVTVPTLLGTTAICYYPPPPVPTLPVPVVGGEHAGDRALESAVARLSLGPERVSDSEGGKVGPGQDVDGAGHTVPPVVQLPVAQEQQYQLDSQRQDPNAHHIVPPPATQLSAEEQQQQQQEHQEIFAAFLEQNQAALAQYPETASMHSNPQQTDQPPVIVAAPLTYHREPPFASPSAGSSQPMNQALTPGGLPPAYHASSTPSPPVGSSQQPDQPPMVGATPVTLRYASPVTSPPAGSPSNPPNIMNTPPPVPPRRPMSGRPTSYSSPRSAPSSSLSQYQNAPLEPPSNAPTGWQPFFLADMTPSPTFVTLMNDVFSYLDPRNLGNLEPEVFSGFLDDLGYMPHENAWKMGLQATYALSAKSMADKSLKNALDLFSIDHVLLKRIQPPHEDPTGVTAQYKRVLGSAFSPAMLQNPGAAHSTMEGPMPALTRKGFVDIMALEAKGEPAREWGNWSRLLRKYNLPRYAGWGDLPRECFLEYPDPLTLRRVEEIRKISERQGQQQLDAARAYSQLAAQGRQNALDLIGDVRYVYR